MSKVTHTAELHAWLASYQRIEGLFDSDSAHVVGALSYTTTGPGEDGYFEKEGYTYVGKASITVAVGAPNDIVQSKIKGLQTQKTSILARAQMEATQLEEQIQKLLAIEFDGGAQ